MKLLSRNKLFSTIATAVSALVFLANPLVQAAECLDCIPAKPVEYFQKYPWLGLVIDEINYGPITISNVHLNGNSKLAMVKPGEVIRGNLHYRIDSSNQEMFHRHHLAVGIVGVGAQDCIGHNWGFFNSNTRGSFSLKAPLKPGLYEVRFFYQEADTCEGARSIWNSNPGTQPDDCATIGAILVTE